MALYENLRKRFFSPVVRRFHTWNIPVRVTSSTPDIAQNHLYMYLKKSPGLTDSNIAVNGSIAAATYSYVCPDDTIVVIERCCLVIVDAGIQPTKFGGLATLANGITFTVTDKDGSEILDFLDGEGIKHNKEFGELAGVNTSIDDGAGDDAVAIQWSLPEAGQSLLLTEGQSFNLIVRDDLSDLTTFQSMVQGSIYTV